MSETEQGRGARRRESSRTSASQLLSPDSLSRLSAEAGPTYVTMYNSVAPISRDPVGGRLCVSLLLLVAGR